MNKLQRYDQKIGYSQLDELIETLGEKGLMSLIVEKLSRGINPARIAEDLSLPFMVMWEWLEADPARQRMYNAGYEMWANQLHHETVGIADSADITEVQLAKLRIDTRFKAASNYDKKRFGTVQQTQAHGFAGGVTIVIGEVRVQELSRPQEPRVVMGEVVTQTLPVHPVTQEFDPQADYQNELAEHNAKLEAEEV